MAPEGPLQSDQNPYRIRDLTSPKPLLLLQPRQALCFQLLAWEHHRDSRGIGADQFSGNAPTGLAKGTASDGCDQACFGERARG